MESRHGAAANVSEESPDAEEEKLLKKAEKRIVEDDMTRDVSRTFENSAQIETL